jgi:parallel beta-helix repeat protein
LVSTNLVIGIAKVTPPSVVTIHNGQILYVGGFGPGNFSKIQDAINNASDGDTIFVYNDSSPYYENITINKCIKLIGENRNSTIICGKLDTAVIKIYNESKISNFNITNGYYGIYIIDCGNCVISNNIFTEIEVVNIHVDDSNNNLIQNNTIVGKGQHEVGILILSGFNSEILISSPNI